MRAGSFGTAGANNCALVLRPGLARWWRWPRNGCKYAHPTGAAAQVAELPALRRSAPGLSDLKGRHQLRWCRHRLSRCQLFLLYRARSGRKSPARRKRSATGPFAKQASNTVRAERRFLPAESCNYHFGKPRYREVPRCAGPLDPAFRAPLDLGGPEIQTTATPGRKEQGRWGVPGLRPIAFRRRLPHRLNETMERNINEAQH